MAAARSSYNYRKQFKKQIFQEARSWFEQLAPSPLNFNVVMFVMISQQYSC